MEDTWPAILAMAGGKSSSYSICIYLHSLDLQSLTHGSIFVQRAYYKTKRSHGDDEVHVV